MSIKFTNRIFIVQKNFAIMTQIAINEQIEAIKKVTQEALKSPETALKFLIDAGIVRDQVATTLKPAEEKKK
jgi:hypothetical protein